MIDWLGVDTWWDLLVLCVAGVIAFFVVAAFEPVRIERNSASGAGAQAGGKKR